jgi:hypothetical protein
VKVTNTTNIKKRAITTHLKSLNTKKTSTYMYDVRCFLMMTWQITVLYMFSYDDLTNHSVIHVFLWWPDKSQCYTCFYLMMTWQITVLYMFLSYDDLTNHSVIHVFILWWPDKSLCYTCFLMMTWQITVLYMFL